MTSALKRLLFLFKRKSKKDERLITAIKTIVGSRPFNLELYHLATQHTSIAKTNKKGLRESNERLEYLGDAVLGAAVADYLFKKFPFKDEGFLTEIRSRIVNRESLNMLGKKIGLDNVVQFDQSKKGKLSHKSLYGDTLEAIVGAVYLDRGYRFCSNFILKKLIIPYYNLDEIVKSNTNYKSQLIEWAQKESKEVKFEIVNIKNNKHHKEFTAQVTVDDKLLGQGFGYNKKKAEQDAAQKSCEILQLNQN
ncbi:MAG: ribonuclease III [Bacteroidota bacterium]